jgi:DNA-binding NarL/FixJ family response regulator
VSLRCVIVDDNPGFLHAATKVLEGDGVTVVGVASTSSQAVERCAELSPDVMLVDIKLGQEDGFELVRRLRRTRSGDPCRVILISTYAERDFADLIAASSALGFLPKRRLSRTAIQELIASATPGR